VTPHQLNLLAVVSLAVCWTAFALIWLAGAIYNQSRAPEAERTRRWFSRTGWVIVGVAWVVVPRAGWNFLAVHAPLWARILGLAILLAATVFTLWSRLALGTMWSGAPMVRQQHRLRTSGPYSVTRHPIYTGMLGMMLGSLLLAGGGYWILPFPVFLVLLEIKIRVEERLMLTEFPDDYPRYRQRVPQLVPGLRLVSRHGMASEQAR
jgi:protein-S-isoprenylcysteine O-methyltransferase Ste14